MLLSTAFFPILHFVDVLGVLALRLLVHDVTGLVDRAFHLVGCSQPARSSACRGMPCGQPYSERHSRLRSPRTAPCTHQMTSIAAAPMEADEQRHRRGLDVRRVEHEAAVRASGIEKISRYAKPDTATSGHAPPRYGRATTASTQHPVTSRVINCCGRRLRLLDGCGLTPLIGR